MKKALRCIIFMAVLLAVIFMASNILKKKESYYYKDQFFASNLDYDVLFFGSSHMHEGIDPIYLWENYGISSYNLASAGESIQMTYHVVRAALEHTHPKAVIIDSFKIADEENEINEGYAFVHESIDALPLGKNKLEAIDYASRFFDGGKMAFLSNMYAYHSRFSELEKKDFVKTITYDKGAYIMTEVVKAEAPEDGCYIEDTTELKGGDGVKAYKKIVELCREKGVIPILVNIPANKSNYSEKEQKKLNTLMEYTRENGGRTINFLPLLSEVGIDYDTDFGDSSHLNHLGAAKTADYLAKYLYNEMGIEDHRGDENYSFEWDRDVKAWNDQKIELLKDKNDAVSYIFLAEGEDRQIKVFMANPDQTSGMYGLDFCLEKTGIEPEKVEKDDIGGFDMKVEVRRKSDGTWLAAQYFYRNDSGNFTVK
ncbi:MAG: hypothetical protein K6G84_12690 [Lachnospiraceae bacterium]|nr:hypothetical protein [Lachnospiraceae bacterium]